MYMWPRCYDGHRVTYHVHVAPARCSLLISRRMSMFAAGVPELETNLLAAHEASNSCCT